MSTMTTLHITERTPAPQSHLSVYDYRSPIAGVDLDGGAISICATDPADLRKLAQVCTDLAQQLADQLDVEAARAVNETAPVAEQVPA